MGNEHTPSSTRLTRNVSSRDLSENFFNSSSPRKRQKRDLLSTPAASSTSLSSNRRSRASGHSRSERPSRNARITSLSTPRPPALAETPTFDSAAAAAAAAKQGDGFKPREERGWEEFHPELDLELQMPAFTADEVDGVAPGDTLKPGTTSDHLALSDRAAITTPPKRRPGRPPRNPDAMLIGLGSPQTPRITPLPAQNPREKLNLPKPSFRQIETFAAFESDRSQSINYVDKSMAHVGFQETDRYLRSDKHVVRLEEDPFDEEDRHQIVLASDPLDDDGKSGSAAPAVSRVEYDMDEQDEHWLDVLNIQRKDEGVEPIRPAIFEISMTQIEKEWHAMEKRIPKPNPKPPQTHRPRSSSAAAVNGEAGAAGEEQDSKCAVCDDGDCENTNAIVFCDGCDLAVHQECYGVPFIPEGQWLCRKCQLVGRNLPTCIFCPNPDGAFKLTHESRWAHLLCAIWIPEVSLGNTTFMEPIMDVGRVPKDRWRLTCYICNQKMGACIQCGMRNCCEAFHVTCARRAKLYLKMKSTHGGPSSIDASALTAFCHKHSPPEWTKGHDTDRALHETRRYYRRKMKGRVWADSKKSALAELPQNQQPQPDLAEEASLEGDSTNAATAAQKKQRLEAQKNIWRLPSGAPIVPNIVFNAVESSLARFTIRKRKEFVAEACKYWTLKREARRGASLLKRLQLQLETFSSSELTRRNFTAMGPAGRARLQRRIDMADQLIQELETVQELCKSVNNRETSKWSDAELLVQVVDTIYFPASPKLVQAMTEAIRLDKHKAFSPHFEEILTKVAARAFTCVRDFVHEFAKTMQSKLSALASEQPSVFRDTKPFSKRIVRAVTPLLKDATCEEAVIHGRDDEDEIAELDRMLESCTGDHLSEAAMSSSDGETNGLHSSNGIEVNGAEAVETPGTSINGDEHVAPNGHMEQNAINAKTKSLTNGHVPDFNTPSKRRGRNNTAPDVGENGDVESEGADWKPRSKAASVTEKVGWPVPQGGISWFLEKFEPDGTTVQDEKWTGRDVMRGLSEELSDIDEAELDGLGQGMVNGGPTEDDASVVDNIIVKSKSAPAKKRKARRFY